MGSRQSSGDHGPVDTLLVGLQQDEVRHGNGMAQDRAVCRNLLPTVFVFRPMLIKGKSTTLHASFVNNCCCIVTD